MSAFLAEQISAKLAHIKRLRFDTRHADTAQFVDKVLWPVLDAEFRRSYKCQFVMALEDGSRAGITLYTSSKQASSWKSLDDDARNQLGVVLLKATGRAAQGMFYITLDDQSLDEIVVCRLVNFTHVLGMLGARAMQMYDPWRASVPDAHWRVAPVLLECLALAGFSEHVPPYETMLADRTMQKRALLWRFGAGLTVRGLLPAGELSERLRHAWLPERLAAWCAVERFTTVGRTPEADMVADTVVLYGLGCLQASLWDASKSAPVAPFTAAAFQEAAHAEVKQAIGRLDDSVLRVPAAVRAQTALDGTLLPLFGTGPLRDYVAGTLRHFGVIVQHYQASIASPAARQLAVEVWPTTLVPRDELLEVHCCTMPWQRELVARNPELSCVLAIHPVGAHREPLALLTALCVALPDRCDGTDYVVLVEPRAYAPSMELSTDGKSLGKRKQDATKVQRIFVALDDAQRVQLQVAAQSLLLIQRSSAAYALKQKKNQGCALASPLLASTLAQSTNTAELCHALNALGAQLGLSPSEWWSETAIPARVQRTARLCVAVAELFIEGSAERALHATLGRLRDFFNNTKGVARDGRERVNPNRRNPERSNLARYDPDGLHSALQVVLLGDRLSLVMPRETVKTLVGLNGTQRVLPLYETDFDLALQTVDHDYGPVVGPQYKDLLAPNASADAPDECAERDKLERRLDGHQFNVCACNGARVTDCMHMLRQAVAHVNHTRCCICELDQMRSARPLESKLAFMQGVCKYCLERVPWRSTTADVRVDDNSWVPLDVPHDIITLLVSTALDGDARVRAECVAALASMRQRVRRWVTNAGALRKFETSQMIECQRGSASQSADTTCAAFSTFIDAYAARLESSQTPEQGIALLRSAVALEVSNARRNLVAATLAVPLSKPGTTDGSFSLGLFMSAAETIGVWQHTPLLVTQARIDQKMGNDAPRRARTVIALCNYLMPLGDLARYNAYVAAQRAGTLFPFIESAIIGSVEPAGEPLTVPQQLVRTLHPDGFDRPLTGMTPWLLESALLNSHAT